MELYDIHLRRYKLALSKLGIDWIHEQYYHLFAIHDWKTCAWVATKLNHYAVNTFDGCGKMQLFSATQVVTLKYGFDLSCPLLNIGRITQHRWSSDDSNISIPYTQGFGATINIVQQDYLGVSSMFGFWNRYQAYALVYKCKLKCFIVMILSIIYNIDISNISDRSL